MKNASLVKFNKIKPFFLSLLIVLSCVFIGLGIFGNFGKQQKVAEAASGETMVAWYKFNSATTYANDSTGNYNLNAVGSGTWTTDGWQFANDGAGSIAYATSAEQNPITYFGAGSPFTFSVLYFSGSNCGGGNNIFATESTRAGFTLAQDWGNIKMFFSNAGEFRLQFPVPNQTWLRIFVWSDGNAYHGSVYNVATKSYINGSAWTNNVEDSGDNYNVVAPGLVLGTSYSLSSNTNAFCIGNKIAYGGSGGDAGMNTGDRKIADLRIYGTMISDAEKERIIWGDTSRNTQSELKFSYRPYLSSNISTVATNLNEPLLGATDGPVWDAKEFATQFRDGTGLLYAPDFNYTNAVTSANMRNDWSDYIRHGSFSVSFRMYLRGAWISGDQNEAYYMVSTGHYADSFAISVDWGSMKIFIGDGADGNAHYLQFNSIFDSTIRETWVRGYISYGNDTVTGWVYNESNQQTINGELYLSGENQTYTKIDGLSFQGGSFGGYQYDFAMGGQSNYGENEVMTAYNASVGRNMCRISRFDMYTGILTQSEIDALNAIDDNCMTLWTAPETFEKVAHYEFKDANNLGYDSVNKYHLLNGGSASYDSTNGGMLLGSNNADNTSKSYLYSQPVFGTTEGIDPFDRYRGSMTVSFRAKLKAMTDSAFVIIGSGAGAGFFISVKNDGMEIKSGSQLMWVNNVFSDTPEWYRINVSFNSSTNEVSVQVIKQIEDKLTSVSNTRTATGMDFGGDFSHTLTIGGVTNNANTKLIGGAGGTAKDGTTYYPTLSDLRIYTGVLTEEEKKVIDQYDTALFKLDTSEEGSKVNLEVSDDLASNFWIKMTGGSNPWLAFSYNGYNYTKYGTEYDDVTKRVKISVTGMAPQDMNDKITITGGQYTYQGFSYDLDFNNWDRMTFSVKDYLTEVVQTYGQDSVEGKRAIYMLNYGAEAQRITTHDLNDLANAGLTADQRKMTGWSSDLLADGGHIKSNEVWGNITSEGNGNTNIIRNISVAPRYDNRLGFIVKLTLADASTDFTVQFSSADGSVVKEFTKADMAVNPKYPTLFFFKSGGVVDMSNLAQEFRVKVFVNGTQEYNTVCFNYLHFVRINHTGCKDSNLLRFIYSLYATTLA